MTLIYIINIGYIPSSFLFCFLFGGGDTPGSPPAGAYVHTYLCILRFIFVTNKSHA
jgi:hypothetical protein